MTANFTKRCLSFLLAMLMVFSLLPVNALAAEEDTHDHDHSAVEGTPTSEPSEAPTSEPTEAPVDPVEDKDAYNQYQRQIDDILNAYLESTELTADEIRQIVSGLDSDTIRQRLRRTYA